MARITRASIERARIELDAARVLLANVDGVQTTGTAVAGGARILPRCVRCECCSYEPEGERPGCVGGLNGACHEPAPEASTVETAPDPLAGFSAFLGAALLPEASPATCPAGDPECGPSDPYTACRHCVRRQWPDLAGDMFGPAPEASPALAIATGDVVVSELPCDAQGPVIGLDDRYVTVDDTRDGPMLYGRIGLARLLDGAWGVIARRAPAAGETFRRTFCAECNRFMAILATHDVPAAICYRCSPDGYAALLAPPACPGCSDRPCDGTGAFPGTGRVCVWCQESGHCPTPPVASPADDRRAVVVAPNGTTTRVRNLGWLLRHAHQVTAVEFWARARDDAPGADLGGRLLAQLDDGRTYSCDWASRAVFAGWIGRPRFAHLVASYI